jgi:uncharacterized protein
VTSIPRWLASVLSAGSILLAVSVFLPVAYAADQAAREALMTPNGLVAPDGSKPLPPLKNTLSWAVLQQVQSAKTQSADKKDVWLPKFTAEQKKLHKKPIKLYGFMLPLQAGETQKEFILTPYPPSCPFCMTMGPDSVVQVVCDTPAKVTFEPVVVSGNFVTLEDDPSGFYYRITDATAVEQP